LRYILPLRLGFFFSLRRDLGVGLQVLSLFGNENIARDAKNNRADTITSPGKIYTHQYCSTCTVISDFRIEDRFTAIRFWNANYPSYGIVLNVSMEIMIEINMLKKLKIFGIEGFNGVKSTCG
jgi:hypothetical protein